MENKDIELIEEFNYNFLSATRIGLDFPVTMYIKDDTHNSIMKLLQAYKQDEKVIEEMASYLVKDCEQIEKLECEEIVKRLEKTPYNCIDCIISCFRKKCE